MDNATHLGTHCAALPDGYRPETDLDSLPQTDYSILVAALGCGDGRLPFCRSQFQRLPVPLKRRTEFTQSRNLYYPSSVSVDRQGAMTCASPDGQRLEFRGGRPDAKFWLHHLRLFRTGLDTLEPVAVFGMFTYDYAGDALHNHEIRIEISRWADPAKRHAQNVLQPY